MFVESFFHPVRTYLPCTGVGRHINNILLSLHEREAVDVQLFFSDQWLGDDGEMNPRCPLRDLPRQTFPMPENLTERCWKVLGRPRMDRWVPDDADWVYAPVETYLPIEETPTAVTIHDIQAFETELPWSDTWTHRWFRLKWSTWIHKALRDCRVVFTVSEFSKRRMVELLDANPEKIVVSGNGVELSFFDAAKTEPSDLPRPCPEPYVIVIGGLREKKGGDDVLAIARELERQGSPIQVVVAGPNGDPYAEEARERPNVHLEGMVPDEALPGMVRGAVSLLFLSPYEGCGIPALEAMAAGIPAVVSDRASLPEVTGEAGIVVEPSDTGAIADRLMNLERDASLRERLGRAGRERAKHYTWDRCAGRVLDALHTIA
jgi:glycosyltransferase involved in cell wall biosynthesis